MDLCFLKNLDGRATTKNLVSSITQAIDAGLLNGGEKLPSSREIAQFTGTSRTTVVRAFDELIARGYLNGRKGQATFVAQTYTDSQPLSFEPPLEDEPAKLSGTLPLELLPMREWQRCLALQYTKLTTPECKSEVKAQDLYVLKQAICGFLRRTEGILCFPGNIIVFTGTARAIHCIAKMTANAGIACENKGSATFELFQNYGAQISELSIDGAGARIDARGTAKGGWQWLYVTPTGSRPSGITLSNARRYELIEWARINSATIIENATGSEFQYTANSSPSLFMQDRSSSVIYHRSLTGLLHPLTNLEFLIVPDRFLENFHSACPGLAITPVVEHLALADFINEGFLEKHIRNAWKILRRRRQMLIFALKQSFDRKAEIFASHAGAQILVRFNNQWSRDLILQAAATAGLPLCINYHFCSSKDNYAPEFIIDFSAMAEDKTEMIVRLFAKQLPQANVVSVVQQMIFTP